MKSVRVRLEFNIQPSQSAYLYGTKGLRCESLYMFEDGAYNERGPTYAHPGILELKKRGVLPKDFEVSDRTSRVSHGIHELQMLLGQMTVNKDETLRPSPLSDTTANNFISIDMNDEYRNIPVTNLKDFAYVLSIIQDMIRDMIASNLKSEVQASAVDGLSSEEPPAETAQQSWGRARAGTP